MASQSASWVKMGLDTNVRHSFPGLQGGGGGDAAPDSEFDLRSLLLTVWRGKWLIGLMFLLGIAYSHAQLMRTTPLYTAEARVLLEVNQRNYVDIDPVVSGLNRDYFALASQIEVLESGRLLGRMVKDLELEKDPVLNPTLRPREGWTRWLSIWTIIAEARMYLRGLLVEPEPVTPVEESPEDLRRRLVATLGGAISAEWLDGTYILIIRATTIDPVRSAELANEMARFYILDQLETKFEATRQATDWLTERVADLRLALEAAEQAVEDFSTGSTLISEAALEASARQLKELRERAIALDDERREIGDRLEAAATSRAEDDFAAVATLMREPRLTTLANAIAQLEKPAQTELRAEAIASFDADYDRSTKRAVLAVDRLEGQAASVRKTIVELEKQQEEDTRALVELRQLQREAEASRLIYEFFLARLKETSVQEGIQRPDARILTEAQMPGYQSYPNRSVTLMTGAGSGVILALVLIVLFERMNSSFRSSEELERRTGQSVIGTVPMAPATRRRALLQYLIERPTSSFAEAIRNLRTSVLLANVDDPPQVIMLTSALPGESKTTCCIALAQISRALGKKVLLVECDLRRRTFRHYFELSGHGGLLSVLSGARAPEEVIVHDENSGLDILPGEESSVNAADIFASHRFSDFIAEMRQRYDFIFIDTPPVLAVPDARVIGKISDAVIFCVRWNKTPRESVLEGLRFFAQINVRVAGMVLGQVNVNKMARYGYTSYGYYKEAAKYYHN
jgi:capsular exopolysaccharide synthesis family protein